MLLSLLLALPTLLAPGGLSDEDLAVLVKQSLTSDARASTSADSLGRATNRRPDIDVVRDVHSILKLRQESQLDGLSVNCVQGKVTLRGRAVDAAARARAQDLTSAVSGARSVDNLLTVDGEALEKSTVVAPAAEEPLNPFAFLTRDGLAAANVHISVDGGVVELQGHASSTRARDYATSAARLVPGTKLVRNRMTVRKASPAEDDRLAKLIRRTLEWNGFPAGRNPQINVQVRHGIVTLRGKNVEADRAQFAMSLAANTIGALIVDDQILRR